MELMPMHKVTLHYTVVIFLQNFIYLFSWVQLDLHKQEQLKLGLFLYALP